MHLHKMAIAAGALLLAACSAKPSGSPDVSITGAWSRATVAGQSSAATYLTITDRGDGDDRLMRVATPIGSASLHSSTMNNGVMRMRPLARLDIRAHSTVELKPGGTHIMIMGMKQPLQAGSSFPLTLTFDRSGARRVTVEVHPATSEGAGM